VAEGVGLHAAEPVEVGAGRAVPAGGLVDVPAGDRAGGAGGAVVAALRPAVADVPVVAAAGGVHAAFHPVPVHAELLVDGQPAGAGGGGEVGAGTLQHG